MPRHRQPPRLEVRGGVYYVHWFDDDAGRQRRLSLGTEDAIEAQLRFAAWLTETAGGAMPNGGAPRPPASLTVSEVLELYLAEHVAEKVRGREQQRHAADRLREFMGPVALEAVNVPLCKRYIVHRTAGGDRRPVAPGTVHRELSVLSAAANHCLRHQHIRHEHMPVLEWPERGEARDRWLSFEEWEAMRDMALCVRRGGIWRPVQAGERLPRIYRFVMLAYYTASRRRALETLTWTQVDLARARISLNPAGRRQTKKRRPVVPIAPALLDVLERAYIERRGELVLDQTGDIESAFKGLVARLGSSYTDVTAHTLRHTRATHLAIQGVPFKAIADLLGDTVTTVEKHYAHFAPDYLAEAMENVR